MEVGASGPGQDYHNGTINPDLRTIRVRGMLIDTVSEKLDFNNVDRCYMEQLPDVETMAIKARELSTLHQDHRPYLHAFKTKEPLCRTLIAKNSYGTKLRQAAPESHA